jgi:uncharacterized membrane protein YphA (DoxX/SURF4 family)
MSTQPVSVSRTKRASLAGWLSYLHCRFKYYAARLESPFLLLVRLYWGWQFTQTGWGKLHNLPHVREFFASLGIPAPGVMAPMIASLEFFGGMLLIVGLATRLTGLLLACNMFVAYVTSDRQALKLVSQRSRQILYRRSLYLSFCFAHCADLRGRLLFSRLLLLPSA